MSNYFKNDDLSFQPFTREQEKELFKRASKGDLVARDTIIKNYLQFAASEGLRAARGQFDDDEVLSQATLGLIKAVESFDPKRGNGFACFARRYIVGYVGHLRRDKIRQSNREMSIGVGCNETHSRGGFNSKHSHSGGIPVETVDHPSEEQDWQAFWIEHVRKFLTQLPERQQVVIRAVVFDEKTFVEVAKRLKCTPNTARRAYADGIATLKRLVKKVQT